MNGIDCFISISRSIEVDKMKTGLLVQDYARYPNEKDMPRFQFYCRKITEEKNPLLRFFWRVCFRVAKERKHIDMSYVTPIGGGLYIGHPYCITINHDATIGKNVNIHKGVTIGRENRGVREGVPTIGNRVWIGINSTVVGKIKVGNDVLIAPNTFVNRDIPSHSVVFGNPCVVKHKENATAGYIENTVDE